MEEKLINVFISDDQLPARVQKLEKKFRKTRASLACTIISLMMLYTVVYLQQKQIDELMKEKEDETAG